MRLVRTIIALLLAVSLGVIPVALSRAFAASSAFHVMMPEAPDDVSDTVSCAGDDHTVDQAAAAEDEAAIPGAHKHTGEAGGHKHSGKCCMRLCHVLSLIAGPPVSTEPTWKLVLNEMVDQQVTGSFTDRIDRPPKRA